MIAGAASTRVSRLVAGCLLWLAAAAHADGGIEDWLMRIEMAPINTSYSGSFIYERDGAMETMRIAHRVDGADFRQRLYSLTGSAREIIRDSESVWCFIPDRQIGVHEYSASSRSSFLQIRADKIAAISDHYTLELGAVERIAGRQAQVLRVVPRDRYRYGYVLWADQATGLLLRTDLLGGEGQVVERYMFVDVEIGGEIADADLEPITARESLTWFGIDQKAERPSSAMPMRWDSTALPPGFTLSHSVKRRSPMQEDAVEHHVYSDGLSSVSMFVKEGAEGVAGRPVTTTMGAMSAAMVAVDGFTVTVVGEVPEATVSMIAGGVTHID